MKNIELYISLCLALFNPFNICQFYFSFLDRRFAVAFESKTASEIIFMLASTLILFFIFAFVLNLKVLETKSRESLSV
jgi:hypothetical protein